LKVDNDIDKRIDIQYEESIKVYILRRLKSPIFIVGLILVLIPIIIAIFPQLFTQYSFDETMGLYAGSWNPPSPGHLFGQTQFGRDVYARILYGVRNSLVLGVGATIIGLIGGVNIGFVAGKFKRGGYRPIMSFMLLFYILPSFLFVLLFISILGRSFFISLISIGIFMIPSFTIATANAMSGELNRKTIGKIGKSLINYIPLNIALAILIYTSIVFIGFSDPLSIQLGGEINIGRSNPYTAPWASLWPGLTIFLIVASFFILHLGLKGVERKRSRENEFKAE
jgi:peptide/nickel transport system permease protein